MPSGFRAFTCAAAVVVAAVVALTVFLGLQSGTDAAAVAASAGLLLAGGATAVSCFLRSRRSQRRRRGSWRLIGTAALVAVSGNLIGAASGGPAGLSIPLNDLTIAAALTLSIIALLMFPAIRSRRGLAVLVLDGVVAGSAVLIIASSLIYDNLLLTTSGGLGGLTVLVIPVLDVVVAMIAVLLLVRSNSADRLTLALIASGYLFYMMSDLNYAISQAEGGYVFGTWTDLGWVSGYALIGLAAWAPVRKGNPAVARPRVAEIVGTVTIFAVLLAAGVLQTVNSGGPTTPGRVILWMVLVAAACGRELIISRDSYELRLNLEHRVAAQTADLRHWAEQTRALLDSVADGIYGVDVSGRVTVINRSAREMLGLDDRVIGTAHPHELFHAPAPDGTPYPIEECYVTEAIRHASVARSEDDVYLRSDGTEVAVEIVASPIVDPATSEVTGAVVAFRDVTERREVERMKDRFLSVVSHELRTPLTSIRGGLGLINSGALGALPPEIEVIAASAEESAERLGRLVNDILDVERLASGNFEVRPVPHSAASLIETSATELASLAQRAGVTLEVGDVGGWVVADPDRVAQVLGNLIGNAIKFSEPGDTVRISTAPGRDEVVFAVADEGRGIPADRLEDIFERFRQVDSSDARLEGGTGLGLAITRAIVTQLGGRVWAESDWGKGSTFRFTLPVAPDAGQRPPAKSAL
ncbi:PAS domain-containing sensor histidine kinase [Aeromicrobium piscarium]|uniref:histidine kinase n=1 Tax=Aeromicrobium piscarium TaxID=2590901 RepID=A0A554RTR2_9ACTN|nr:ATP-binding protein [Aeromicrobium piscarium]TSD57496.1 PAS domain S-box protein [Aeromicrobium piscarium]